MSFLTLRLLGTSASGHATIMDNQAPSTKVESGFEVTGTRRVLCRRSWQIPRRILLRGERHLFGVSAE